MFLWSTKDLRWFSSQTQLLPKVYMHWPEHSVTLFCIITTKRGAVSFMQTRFPFSAFQISFNFKETRYLDPQSNSENNHHFQLNFCFCQVQATSILISIPIAGGQQFRLTLKCRSSLKIENECKYIILHNIKLPFALGLP